MVPSYIDCRIIMVANIESDPSEEDHCQSVSYTVKFFRERKRTKIQFRILFVGAIWNRAEFTLRL